MRAFIIENEKITNIIEVEKLSDVSGADADDGGFLGWDYKDGKSSNPNPITIDKAASARGERNYKLQSSDWTQGADVPTALKSKWATYRQELRDLPTSEGFPDSIVWPTEPS